MPADLPLIATLAALIEFGGAIIIAAAVVRALALLALGVGIDRARLLVIEGSLGALGFKTAATALKAIELGTWQGIGMFAAIFALRTVIKRALLHERARLTPAPATAMARPAQLRSLGDVSRR